jgi:hypothetical protein
MTLRFLSVQLFATIAITLASGFLPPGTPLANEMEADPPVGVSFDRLKQQLINPYEGE